MDPISTARYGLMAASSKFEASAERVARMGAAEGPDQAADGDTDIAQNMVDMVQAKQAFSANLTTIRFAQDMWDSLLQLQTSGSRSR